MMYSPVCVFKYTTNKAFYVKGVASAHGIKPGRSREIIHSHTTPNYPILNTETRVENPPEAHSSAKRKWIGNALRVWELTRKQYGAISPSLLGFIQRLIRLLQQSFRRIGM